MTIPDPAAPARGAAMFLRLAALAAIALLAAAAPSFAAPTPLVFGPASRVSSPAGDAIQLAGRKFEASRPPARGSSAELNGGSSADRYGGTSADERGVAGKHDPRNRGVRQFTAQNQKRSKGDHDHVEKNHEDEEMDDQDANPPKEMFRFGVTDPSQALDRSTKD
jgi:hypothetical protein